MNIRSKIKLATSLVESYLPKDLKSNSVLNFFAFTKIPLLAFLSPRIARNDGDVFAVKLPLTFRSKNHLGCMYFAALCAGADTALGFAAYFQIQESGEKINLLF